jgi:calcineurin-like phosphoesterase family protein
MDEEMIRRWNERVRPCDKVYHLGDVVIPRKSLPILERLNGHKILIRGNHDQHCSLKDLTQYFEDVPEVAWNFYIGGYQPAQKWLKDRKDRELQVDDIRHYLKIIVALTETDRLMKEVDKIEIE